MKPSQDQINAAQKLLERMHKEERHTHATERGYGVYEVCGGAVRRIVDRWCPAEMRSDPWQPCENKYSGEEQWSNEDDK